LETNIVSSIGATISGDVVVGTSDYIGALSTKSNIKILRYKNDSAAMDSQFIIGSLIGIKSTGNWVCACQNSPNPYGGYIVAQGIAFKVELHS